MADAVEIVSAASDADVRGLNAASYFENQQKLQRLILSQVGAK